MVNPKYLWRGEPQFLPAISPWVKKSLSALPAIFILGLVLSYVLDGRKTDPLTAFSPYILMLGSLLWLMALLHSAKTRQLSGYESVHYVVTKLNATVLVVKPNVGNRTPLAQAKIVGSWPLDGTVEPRIVGCNILFSQAEAAQSPELSNGFLFLSAPDEALQILIEQIKLNTRHSAL